MSSRHRPAEDRRFRPCVAALIVNAEGKLLICERRDFAESWQFPQGGRDRGELPVEALQRELEEEISVTPDCYEVMRSRPGYRYWFPDQKRRRGRYIGQEQAYSLCRYTGSEAKINLDTAYPEFRSWKWIAPEDFNLAWLPGFKRDVYRRVLKDFFGVNPIEAPPESEPKRIPRPPLPPAEPIQPRPPAAPADRPFPGEATA
jgi:putative (di)nucleoside polyphosphate hydrolase